MNNFGNLKLVQEHAHARQLPFVVGRVTQSLSMVNLS